MTAEAWQYDSAIAVARVFVLRVRLAGVLLMTGKDLYVRGHGRMLGKLLGLVTVADGKGDEFDISELTTYLDDDAVFVVLSFLLRPGVSWAEVDAERFDVTLQDAGRSVSGRVLIDERGAPVDFATTDRFADLPKGLRAEWRTPVSEWVTINGRPVPGPGRCVWNLAEGEFSYLEGRFDPASVAFNVPPTGAEHLARRGAP
jgi:hypothetical protein